MDVKDWQSMLVASVQQALTDDEYWQEKLMGETMSIHLAILTEPYLTYILDGKKTIESRFSANRCAPYKRVSKGDVILLKQTAGPVVGLCEVNYSWDYELEPSSWREIKSDFALALCAQDPKFWEAREYASYATLMRIERVSVISPLSCTKRDRRGWVVLKTAVDQLSLGVSIL